MGFEPTTASLEGWNSTTELRPPIPPVSVHIAPSQTFSTYLSDLPTHKAQPTRAKRCNGGQARIRTLEDISQQIYSLPPLATWVPARNDSLVCVN